jgi:uncharacterized protein (TIGR00297 family)
MVRALAGLLVAGALAFGARAARALSPSGAMAALVVGTLAVTAGWNWAIVLIVFFIVSSALSRIKRATREARIGRIVEKGDERDAWQVFANGGVFAAAAVIAVATENALWAAAAVGALAAAAADTWATEIGTLASGLPRSIISLRPLPPGTSGAVTLPGTLASVAGAAAVAAVAYLTGVTTVLAATFLGGVVGSLADSLVGATIQERRWCDGCSESTERRVHVCGRSTRIVGGVPGARNDFVNVVCTLVGAIVSALLTRLR